MTSTRELDAIIKRQRREALSRHPTLTGIDHIEVGREVRREAARWELLVHFVPPAPEAGGKAAVPEGISTDNIIIRGAGDGPDPRLRVVNVTYPRTQSIS